MSCTGYVKPTRNCPIVIGPGRAYNLSGVMVPISWTESLVSSNRNSLPNVFQWTNHSGHDDVFLVEI